MAFLAPFLPAIIGGAGTAAGALFGRRGGGGGSAAPAAPPRPELYPEERGLLDRQSGLIDMLGESYRNLFSNIAQPSMTAGMNFWLPILQGDRARASEILGPESDAIARSYGTARTNIAATAPRGGVRDYLMTKTRTDQAGDIGRLWSTIRPAAANALTSLGTGAATLGIGAADSATRGTSSALQALAGVRSSQNYGDYLGLLRRGQNIDLGTGLGNLAGSILSRLPWGSWFGGGGGSDGHG